MKKFLIALAASLGLADAVFGIAASQAWVSNYVAQAIATSRAELEATATVTATGGVRVVETGTGMGMVRLVVEDATDAALKATNCTVAATSRGITNGLLFVWNAAGSYVNPLGTVACTASNMVYSGVSSVRTNGLERFAGWFDAYGVLIQPHTSFAITNGMTEANQ